MLETTDSVTKNRLCLSVYLPAMSTRYHGNIICFILNDQNSYTSYNYTETLKKQLTHLLISLILFHFYIFNVF